MTPKLRLIIACPDRVGIVAAVSAFIAAHRGSIIEADYHSDTTTNSFFMRQEILMDSLKSDAATFKKKFGELAKKFNMRYLISESTQKKRVAILVSKQDHCLSDLLYRWRSGEFEFDLGCVISNHDTHRDFVAWHDVPFYHIPIVPKTKAKAFTQIDKLFSQHQIDCVVLARFMQILPAALCKKFAGRIINIHHSFLPSFVGDSPYHKAYARGVKLVGATCHYVTSDLDQGPIIEQDVIRVDHSHSVEDMIRLGKDVEKSVLSRGLSYHVEDRVIVHAGKTVVFK